MTTSNQITPGMVLSLNGKIFRVESSVKVTVSKGNPFVKTKLRDLISDDLIEKNFQVGQKVDEVTLKEKELEFLYPEGKGFLFLDVGDLEQILVPASIVSDKVNYLKEGILVKAMFYGDAIFSIELPQFLELMVVKAENVESRVAVTNATKVIILETGAKIQAPLFVESGDIVKVDPKTNEFIQRV